MQLHLNKWLESFEIIHHKDGNKKNDSLENLEVQLLGDHVSNHHAGSHKIGKYSPSNKLNKSKVKMIFKLSKKFINKKGIPNYSAIGRELKISGLTVSKYLNKNKK